MVFGLARCFIILLKVGLNAVVAHTAEGDVAALHLEVLVAGDAVTYCFGDIQRQVLHRDVVATLDGMFSVAHYSQRAVALQLDLPLAVDASLLLAVSTVGQRVLRTLLGADLYAFLVGDVDGSTVRVGQGHTCQRDCTLVRTGKRQLAIGGAACEGVGDFVIIHSLLVGLADADMRTTDCGIDILSHIACHCDLGSRTLVTHIDIIILHAAVINRHRVNVSQCKLLAHDGQGRTVLIGHLACLRSRELISHAAHLHVQRLPCGCYRQHKGCEECIYLLHFTTILQVLSFVFTIYTPRGN